MEEPRHEQSAGIPEAAEHVGATGTHDKARGPRLREIPLRLMVPNMITVLAICAGLSGVRLAFENRFELAVAMCSLPLSSMASTGASRVS